MLFFLIFSQDSKTNSSYEATLDKADVLNICLTKPTWTTCWFPFLQFIFKNLHEAFLSFSGNSGHILSPKFDTVSFPNNVVLMFLEAR